jgi:AMIN domain
VNIFISRLSRTIVSRLLFAGLCGALTSPSLLAQTSVRTVKVLGARDAVEIEVEASDRIVPQTQVLTGPDRLVIDFPNAVPSNQLRSQSVDRGEVKDVRIGLFQGKPPITRIVLDLKSAQSYQVFPSGRTVIIKVLGAGDPAAGIEHSASEHSPSEPSAPEPATRPGLVIANYVPGAALASVESATQPKLEVSFRDGLLGIRANMATLSEVLFAVQQRTGAEISIAAGAEQEKVVTDIAPGPAPEVLAKLLNGSRFNFLILSAANDPQRLDRVILSARAEGGVMPLPPVETQNGSADNDDAAVPPPVPPPPSNPPPAQNPPGAQLEMKSPPDQNDPNQ